MVEPSCKTEYDQWDSINYIHSVETSNELMEKIDIAWYGWLSIAASVGINAMTPIVKYSIQNFWTLSHPLFGLSYVSLVIF